MSARWLARICVLIVTSLLAAVATADGAQPTLKLVLPNSEQVGQPVAITAIGSSEGHLRLFLFADEQRRSCASTPSLEQHGSWELTPYAGEPLPEGEFSRAYSYTPQVQIAELCAYLDETASATPVTIARTPEPVREYQESATEEPPFSTSTGELPGAIKPLPVNEQLMKEYWARVQREEHERDGVRTNLTPCVVPRLRGRTLAQARHELQSAGCKLGHIRRKRGRPVVISQGVSAGRVLQSGSAVAIVLGSRRR